MYLYVVTDDSMSFDTDSKLKLRLSKDSTNQLYFDNSGKLCTNASSQSGTGYKVLNGINGEPNVECTHLECNSSVSRLASYDDTEGDILNQGRQGDQALDGVNLPNLLTAILGEDVGITWWTKDVYASYVT